jgi:predicted metal-dependent hydrolase
MTANETQHNARIVLERNADKTLTLECYVNGQRKRQTLTYGFELYEIRDALDEQDRQLQAKLAHDLALEEERRRLRHRNNLSYIRSSYGDNFAQRVYGEHFAHEVRKEPKAKVGIEATVDLL